MGQRHVGRLDVDHAVALADLAITKRRTHQRSQLHRPGVRQFWRGEVRLMCSISVTTGSLAEMERELIVERTCVGLDVARQLGRKGGRKPKMTESKIESAKKLLTSGVPAKDVAMNLGMSVPTLYRWVPASAQP